MSPRETEALILYPIYLFYYFTMYVHCQYSVLQVFIPSLHSAFLMPSNLVSFVTTLLKLHSICTASLLPWWLKW